MEFEINRLVFRQELNTVQRAISSKTTIPILTGVKLELTEEGLLLTGSDGDISIESFIAANDETANLQIKQTGVIVLSARILNDIVKSLPENQMHFVLHNENQVEIISGLANFNINGFEAIDYPNLPEVEQNNVLELPVKVVHQLIGETIFAASKTESRPILTGVSFTLKDGNLKAVATDSHRLSQRIITINDNDEDLTMVIPAKSLQEIAHVFTEEDELLQISVSENQALFKSQNLSFYSRLLEGNYPETDRLIPNSFETEVIFDVRELLASIGRASLMSHEGTNTNNIVRLEIKEGQLTLHGNSPEIGHVEEKITPIEVEGADLVISFNPDYMKAALNAIKDKEVKIKFISPIRPFTLEPVDEDTNFIQLITPVRTN